MVDFTHLTLMHVVVILIAYIIGSFSFGIVVSKVVGLADPRSYGSHNPGATNVLRSGHKIAAFTTLLGDAFKGWVVVSLCQWNHFAPMLTALSLLAVFLGHLWPIFFRFQGGKGVATAAGILWALNVWLGLGSLATWIIIAVFFRYSSFAALITALFVPFAAALLLGINTPIFASLCIMSMLLIIRHKANIVHLIQGTETKIGAK